MQDLAEVVDWAQSLAPTNTPQLPGLPDTLELHGVYSSTEINAIFGKDAFHGKGSTGVGVIHFEAQKVIVHLVTFEKNEKQFSETTMYRDFPTAPDLMHWESQAATTQNSMLGRIYANHETLGYRILFFTRIRKEAVTKLAQTIYTKKYCTAWKLPLWFPRFRNPTACSPLRRGIGVPARLA